MVYGAAAWTTEAYQQQNPHIRSTRPVELSLHLRCNCSFLCDLPLAIHHWWQVQTYLFSFIEICYDVCVIINSFSWWSFLFPHIFHYCKQHWRRVFECQHSALPLLFGGLRYQTMHTFTMWHQSIDLNSTWLHSSMGFSHLCNRWSFPNHFNLWLCDTWKWQLIDFHLKFPTNGHKAESIAFI